ncbi:MAG: spermidine synthase [Myxococcota bacterium]
MRPWQVIERADSPDGTLELRRRGARDFLITLDGRVLMSSTAQRSEIALAELGCAPLAGRPAPRVLVAGLGMGITLRAALDALPPAARVEVAELNAVVVAWCRGPLAALTGGAALDPRVDVAVGDVAETIRRAASSAARFDAILLDLYEGPRDGDDPCFGTAGLAAARAALANDGVLCVWSEAPDPAFESRLAAAGFRSVVRRPGRGGRRHAVTLATPAA